MEMRKASSLKQEREKDRSVLSPEHASAVGRSLSIVSSLSLFLFRIRSNKKKMKREEPLFIVMKTTPFHFYIFPFPNNKPIRQRR